MTMGLRVKVHNRTLQHTISVKDESTSQIDIARVPEANEHF